MNPMQVAIMLTERGLRRGKEYSYMGVQLYIEQGPYGAKKYIVLHDDMQRFNSPGRAASVFALLVDKLRRG